MGDKIKAIPEGYGAVTPYLCVKGATAAIDFYKKAFGAVELIRIPGPENTVAHAELSIGGTRFGLCDESDAMNLRSPKSYGGSAVPLLLYVEDCDATAKRAQEAGGKLKKPVTDEFYGDRMGTIEDPFGHVWYVSTHKKDVPFDELKKLSLEKFAHAGAH